MADVFISYKQEERERMRPVANALIELGLEVWFDARLEPGKSFTDEIQHEIDNCRVQIVCWSAAAMASEWVRGEADIGRQRGVLVPVLLEPCRLSPPFNMIHAENLADWDGQAGSGHEGWRKVLRVLSRHIGREIPCATRATLPRQALDQPTPRKVVPFPDNAFPEMVRIPPGRFVMGSPKGENGRKADEGPKHDVQIIHPFDLGKYPVTFAEWDAALSAGASLHMPNDQNWGRDHRPVVDVSWDDAQAYIAFLNDKCAPRGHTGRYRLPSEAEWEYACRGGATEAPRGNRNSTTTVDTYPANALGLHDMLGNVYEWCEDHWHDGYNGAPRDGSAWVRVYAVLRVRRGGSWYCSDQDLRCAARGRGHPSIRGNGSGLRVARTLPKTE